MQKRLLIDMDDVMADTFGQIVKYTNDRVGTSWRKEDIKSHEDSVKFKLDYHQVRDFLWEEGFFVDIPPMHDAVEVIKNLHNHYEIFVVSAATEFPNSLKEKLSWLDQYFPFIGWQHTVFCGHKFMIKADYLIDDHEKNLTKFEGTPLLFDAPHNQDVVGYKRLMSWKEAEQFLLQ